MATPTVLARRLYWRAVFLTRRFVTGRWRYRHMTGIERTVHRAADRMRVPDALRSNPANHWNHQSEAVGPLDVSYVFGADDQMAVWRAIQASGVDITKPAPNTKIQYYAGLDPAAVDTAGDEPD